MSPTDGSALPSHHARARQALTPRQALPRPVRHLPGPCHSSKTQALSSASLVPKRKWSLETWATRSESQACTGTKGRNAGPSLELGGEMSQVEGGGLLRLAGLWQRAPHRAARHRDTPMHPCTFKLHLNFSCLVRLEALGSDTLSRSHQNQQLHLTPGNAFTHRLGLGTRLRPSSHGVAHCALRRWRGLALFSGACVCLARCVSTLPALPLFQGTKNEGTGRPLKAMGLYSTRCLESAPSDTRSQEH